MQKILLTERWRGFAAGQRIKMQVVTIGTTANDEEITYPVGTAARIEKVVDFGSHQGIGVHVIVGKNGREICNSFDDLDVSRLGGLPFLPT